MAYPITTRTTLPGFAQPETTVHRRFKDVVALSDLLNVGGAGGQGALSGSPD